MEHSIAAKYAARPVARFVRPSVRARQRRLGLAMGGSFRPAPTRATVLHGSDQGPFVQLRAGGRSMRTTAAKRSIAGQPRPAVTMHWARSGRSGPKPRSSAASAPWPG